MRCQVTQDCLVHMPYGGRLFRLHYLSLIERQRKRNRRVFWFGRQHVCTLKLLAYLLITGATVFDHVATAWVRRGLEDI